MTIELKCPSCGGTVMADNALHEVFCTYCGTKFPVQEARAAAHTPETLAYVRNAYAVGEFAEAARCADEAAEEPILAVYGAAAYIRLSYANYIERAVELYNKQSAKAGLLRLVTGRDSYGEDSLHTEFFEGVKAKCAALAAAAGAMPADEEAAALCVDTAAQMLRAKNAEKDVATYWSECALEHEVIGLLPCLPSEALAELYESYILRNKPHELLPNQTEAEKAMKRELESRGIKPPTRPGFADKLRTMFGGKDKN